MAVGTMLKVGYWNIRGLMQPIRMMMEYTGTGYTEKLYEVKSNPDGTYDRSMWLNDRESLGLEFPNLPYMIDEESKVTLTQSKAIMRYIAAKNHPSMLGTNPVDIGRIEMLMGVIADFNMSMVTTAYSQDEQMFKQGREKLVSRMREFLERMGIYMKGRKYCMGDEVTVPDFMLHEVLEQASAMVPELFTDQKTDWVRAFMTNFESQPRIAAYIKSSKYMKRPFNNKQAFFR